MEYKKLTKDEIETVFDKMTGYGLDLLQDVIEAWQYDHEEDGKILKQAYNDIRQNKKESEYGLSTPRSLIIGVKKSLKDMDSKQLSFIEEILEIDPYDVFGDNPYMSYDIDEDLQKEYVGVSPYEEICGYVNKERERRLSYFVNTGDLFDKRYKKSMGEKNNLVNIDTNELFSKRYKKSMSKKLTYKSDDFSSYSK